MISLARFASLVLGSAMMLAVASCSRQPRYVVDDPETLTKLDEAWNERTLFPPLNPLDYYLPLYSKYLSGLKICLDPGHGGDAAQARYKRGPTDYREAIMNWKVANYLKGFLEQSGAQVKLTRDGDVEVSLADRVKIANEWGADIFLSIHHNAGPPKVNRTTTWFHFDPDLEPASLDIARYIQQGVTDTLRLPQLDGAPLKSDRMMYDTGFGVLRGLTMPACLCEASFFTHPYEEYRLKQDWYLKREAYGLFLGLAKYAWMGIPRARLIEPAPDGVTTLTLPFITMKVDTGIMDRPFWGSDRPWVFSESVAMSLDGHALPATFDPVAGLIRAQVAEPLAPGEHVVEGRFRNYNGNHSHPLKQRFRFEPLEPTPTPTVTPTLTPLATPATTLLRGDEPTTPIAIPPPIQRQDTSTSPSPEKAAQAP